MTSGTDRTKKHTKKILLTVFIFIFAVIILILMKWKVFSFNFCSNNNDYLKAELEKSKSGKIAASRNSLVDHTNVWCFSEGNVDTKDINKAIDFVCNKIGTKDGYEKLSFFKMNKIKNVKAHMLNFLKFINDDYNNQNLIEEMKSYNSKPENLMKCTKFKDSDKSAMITILNILCVFPDYSNVLHWCGTPEINEFYKEQFDDKNSVFNKKICYKYKKFLSYDCDITMYEHILYSLLEYMIIESNPEFRDNYIDNFICRTYKHFSSMVKITNGSNKVIPTQEYLHDFIIFLNILKNKLLKNNKNDEVNEKIKFISKVQHFIGLHNQYFSEANFKKIYLRVFDSITNDSSEEQRMMNMMLYLNCFNCQSYERFKAFPMEKGFDISFDDNCSKVESYKSSKISIKISSDHQINKSVYEHFYDTLNYGLILNSKNTDFIDLAANSLKHIFGFTRLNLNIEKEEDTTIFVTDNKIRNQLIKYIEILKKYTNNKEFLTLLNDSLEILNSPTLMKDFYAMMTTGEINGALNDKKLACSYLKSLLGFNPMMCGNLYVSKSKDNYANILKSSELIEAKDITVKLQHNNEKSFLTHLIDSTNNFLYLNKEKFGNNKSIEDSNITVTIIKIQDEFKKSISIKSDLTSKDVLTLYGALNTCLYAYSEAYLSNKSNEGEQEIGKLLVDVQRCISSYEFMNKCLNAIKQKRYNGVDFKNDIVSFLGFSVVCDLFLTSHRKQGDFTFDLVRTSIDDKTKTVFPLIMKSFNTENSKFEDLEQNLKIIVEDCIRCFKELKKCETNMSMAMVNHIKIFRYTAYNEPSKYDNSIKNYFDAIKNASECIDCLLPKLNRENDVSRYKNLLNLQIMFRSDAHLLQKILYRIRFNDLKYEVSEIETGKIIDKKNDLISGFFLKVFNVITNEAIKKDYDIDYDKIKPTAENNDIIDHFNFVVHNNEDLKKMMVNDESAAFNTLGTCLLTYTSQFN